MIPAQCSMLIVGGTFDEQGGRPSGYVRRLGQALASLVGPEHCRVINGGTFEQLSDCARSMTRVTHLLWLADIPNRYPKLIPELKQRFPRLVLVSSKNNRRRAYSREQLFERMRLSQSTLLLEFTEDPSGKLLVTLLSSCRTVLLDGCSDIDLVASSCVLVLVARAHLEAIPT